jgi:hypothetical protein
VIRIANGNDGRAISDNAVRDTRRIGWHVRLISAVPATDAQVWRANAHEHC